MGWYTDYDDGTRDDCGLTREQREAQEEMQREYIARMKTEQHGDYGRDDDEEY